MVGIVVLDLTGLHWESHDSFLVNDAARWELLVFDCLFLQDKTVLNFLFEIFFSTINVWLLLLGELLNCSLLGQLFYIWFRLQQQQQQQQKQKIQKTKVSYIYCKSS